MKRYGGCLIDSVFFARFPIIWPIWSWVCGNPFWKLTVPTGIRTNDCGRHKSQKWWLQVFWVYKVQHPFIVVSSAFKKGVFPRKKDGGMELLWNSSCLWMAWSSLQNLPSRYTLPETNMSHLKMDDWKRILSFWGSAHFQVLCKV